MIKNKGFSVNSLLLKKGISPIITLNTSAVSGQTGGNVSDIFNDLVVPNWAISYGQLGGTHKSTQANEPDDSEIIEDDMYDKLLDLVKEFENEKTTISPTKKKTRNNKFSLKSKKNMTKKHKN